MVIIMIFHIISYLGFLSLKCLKFHSRRLCPSCSNAQFKILSFSSKCQSLGDLLLCCSSQASKYCGPLPQVGMYFKCTSCLFPFCPITVTQYRNSNLGLRSSKLSQVSNPLAFLIALRSIPVCLWQVSQLPVCSAAHLFLPLLHPPLPLSRAFTKRAAGSLQVTASCFQQKQSTEQLPLTVGPSSRPLC